MLASLWQGTEWGPQHLGNQRRGMLTLSHCLLQLLLPSRLALLRTWGPLLLQPQVAAHSFQPTLESQTTEGKGSGVGGK